MSGSEGMRQRVRAAASFTFARSGGPGGQNVNKVSSKVVARLRLDAPGLIPAARVAEAAARLGARVNERGELVVMVQDTREQSRNREIAIERMAALLAGALRRPKRRKATRPSRGSREARLSSKRHRGLIKSDRRGAEDE